MIGRALPSLLGILAFAFVLVTHTAGADSRPKQRVYHQVTPTKIASARAQIEVLWGGSWWKATTIAKRRGFTKIHYVGWSAKYDEWVQDNRVRKIARVAAKARGSRTEILWGGTWWAGKIIGKRAGLIKVHYTGYGTEWDQWVEPHRVRTRPARTRRAKR